ncbi:MAG TPA: hypothetical protein VF543_19380 [Pyrinomonadaceae bacterium]|jgi:nucleoside 2-deoxyribosyltransferase
MEQKESDSQKGNIVLVTAKLDNFLKKIDSLKSLMIAVATGTPIDEKEDEYKTLYEEVEGNIEEFQQVGLPIHNPNNFRSLWDWYEYWKSNNLSSYQSRRQYIRKLYEEVVISIQSALKKHRIKATTLENLIEDIVDRLRQTQLVSVSSSIPVEIQESLIRFHKDHPDSSKAAFILMKFSKTRAHEEIVSAIRKTLSYYDIAALRADDKEYHEDLYYNVLTYIYGCGFGIAVFERIEAEEFNPNVSLEVGYMSALRKPVCLLKDRTLKTLHTDLIGKLYRPFDAQDISLTIQQELSKWLKDKNLDSKLSTKQELSNQAIVNDYIGDVDEVIRSSKSDAELNMANLLEYLPKRVSKIQGFHISPKNTTSNLTEVITNLWRFGINSLLDLDHIITEEYISTLVKHQIYPTYESLLEDAMIYHDIDRYFEKAYSGWNIASYDLVNIMNEKYGEEKVKEIFDRYSIISDYDLM